MGSKNGSVAINDETIATKSDEARQASNEFHRPYTVDVTIEGVAPILCHRFDCSEVEQQQQASGKGGKKRKTDNVPSYVYLTDDGLCGIPARNLKSMLAGKKDGAARSFQDPRSKRKNACSLWQASLFVSPDVVPFEGKKKTWDFLDRSRQCVQGGAVVRVRPGFAKGWRLSFSIACLQPDLVPVETLRQGMDVAANFCGLGDSRPDFGRFQIVSWNVRNII